MPLVVVTARLATLFSASRAPACFPSGPHGAPLLTLRFGGDRVYAGETGTRCSLILGQAGRRHK